MQTDTAAIGRGAIETALWRNRLLLAVVTLHLGFGLAVTAATGHGFGSGTIPLLIGVLKTTSLVFAVNFLLWRFGYCLIKVRPRRPTQWLVADLRRILGDGPLIADAAVAFAAITVMAATFTILKDLIAVLQPFSWDPAFAALDRALHGGTDPWRLLWPVFGTPWATTALNAAYHAWFVALYFLVFIAVFDRDAPLRRATFLVAFALTWAIGGNLLATVFSSAGPVYFQAFGFGDDFVPQMQALAALDRISPVWALDLQQMLLDNFRADGPVKGISAMPSMHVATSVIMAAYGFRLHRALGWALSVFAGLILIGSVHLAWHYAIDGYAGIALALAIWWISARLAARFA